MQTQSTTKPTSVEPTRPAPAAQAPRPEPAPLLTDPKTRAAQAAVEAEAAAKAAQSDREAVKAAVGKLNDFVKIVRRDLHFAVDEKSGRTIITVVDAETKEVIRQIPPEEVLAIADNLDSAQGLLFKAKA